jgi:ABC-type glycerol-3-phosphate transport system substrate-binding protein
MSSSAITKGKLWRKMGLSAAASVVAVGLIAGCSGNTGASSDGQSSPSSTSGGKGATITIGAEAGSPYTDFYKKMAPRFTEKTGIQVQFMEVPHDNMHERFITEAASGTGAIDVYVTDQPWISEFAKQGFLEPLDDRISADDKKDFVPSALDAVSYEGKIYALPFLVHTPILYYRTDLFEQAGFKEPPKTWDEFRRYAKALTKDGVYGTIVEGKQSGEPVTHLIDRFLQAGGSILDGDRVTLDSKENVDAFNFLLGIQQADKSSPAGAVSFDNADAHNMFMQGKVAMVYNWPYMYTMANDPSQSKVAGKFAIATQPAGAMKASAVWSWGFGISSGSKNKDAAMQWLSWATSTEVMTEFGKTFINPVARTSAVEALNADTSLKAEDKQAIEVMSKAVQYGRNVTTNPSFPAIQERLAVSLSKIMTGQSKPEDELKAAASDIKSILNP